jgi:hypothetical protein
MTCWRLAALLSVVSLAFIMAAPSAMRDKKPVDAMFSNLASECDSDPTTMVRVSRELLARVYPEYNKEQALSMMMQQVINSWKPVADEAFRGMRRVFI